MVHRPPPLSRRALLQGGLGLGALAAFGAPGIRALGASDAIQSDQYFLFCYFQGGWDLLLSLDPRDPAIFRNDTKKLTGIQTGFDLLPGSASLVRTSVDDMVFGPYIGALADHADKLVVVRGMSMDTLTHEVGLRPVSASRSTSPLASVTSITRQKRRRVLTLSTATPAARLSISTSVATPTNRSSNSLRR